jgi:tRNA A37 threonylcarbamoyladenosine biosynthesis protein TsaE
MLVAIVYSIQTPQKLVGDLGAGKLALLKNLINANFP